MQSLEPPCNRPGISVLPAAHQFFSYGLHKLGGIGAPRDRACANTCLERPWPSFAPFGLQFSAFFDDGSARAQLERIEPYISLSRRLVPMTNGERERARDAPSPPQETAQNRVLSPASFGGRSAQALTSRTGSSCPKPWHLLSLQSVRLQTMLPWRGARVVE